MLGNRAQRKVFQSRIKAARKAVLREGLPLGQDRAAMASLAHIMRGKLLEQRNPDRVVDVARIAAEIFEISLSRNPPVKPLDCKRGCSYCCHRMVCVSAPEAFLIAQEISNTSVGFLHRDAYFERAADTTGLDPDARHNNRTPCALLDKDACAIYSARPLACRSNASHSVQACLAAFRGEDANIPNPKVHLFLSDRCRMTIYAALRSLDYPALSYELSEAVSVILREENARERWYAREDIFAGVQAPKDRSVELDAVITEIARAIAF